MSKEELKPIDVSKYTVTENGNVIKSEEKETTKEDFFRQNFSEYCRGDTFLSPYWDLFETGYELKQNILSQHILELQADKGRLTDENSVLAQNLEDTEICENGWKNRVRELEAQIEKIKSQYDYAFNQLCESREIICSMLSQYRDKKEIDYSTRECGEKLLKQGVYKNESKNPFICQNTQSVFTLQKM